MHTQTRFRFGLVDHASCLSQAFGADATASHSWRRACCLSNASGGLFLQSLSPGSENYCVRLLDRAEQQ